MDFLPGHCASQSVGTMNTLITLVIQTLIKSHCSISPPDVWPEDYKIPKDGFPDYDYVIAGAGASGSVVANRLSEDPQAKILIIEAGGRPPTESEVPYFCSAMRNTTVDRGIFAEPSERYGRSLPNGVPMTTAKVIGGHNSMDQMFYVRGNRRDYKKWEDLGNPGWNMQNILKYFKRSENMLVAEILDKYPDYHATGGFLKVDRFNYTHPMKQCLLEAIQEVGLTKLVDVNAVDHIGLCEATGTINRCRRSSCAKTYLVPASKRPNLHFIKGTTGLKFIFNHHKKIIGLKAKIGNELYILRAKKEYILSMGTLQTPKFLMLSGIGPTKYLSRMGIKARTNLKGVGGNLQDHIFVPYFVKVPCGDGRDPDMEQVISYVKYLLENDGPYTSASDILAFFNTKDPKSPFPDIQVSYTPYNKFSPDMERDFRGQGYGDSLIKRLKYINKKACIIQFQIILLNPKSRGKVLLRTTDPDDEVGVFPDYLRDPEDIKVLVKAIRNQQQLLYSQCFTDNEAEEIYIKIPDCYDYNYDKDNYWQCYIRNFATSYQERVGTLKMGPKTDPYAVVSHKLMLHGHENVRIVGSSIFPTIPSGNILAPTVMVAERAADFIKNGGGRRKNKKKRKPFLDQQEKSDEKVEVQMDDNSSRVQDYSDSQHQDNNPSNDFQYDENQGYSDIFQYGQDQGYDSRDYEHDEMVEDRAQDDDQYHVYYEQQQYFDKKPKSNKKRNRRSKSRKSSHP